MTPAEELRAAASLLRDPQRRPELAAVVDLPHTEPLAELLTYVADQYDGTVATAREVYGDAQGLRMAETMFRTGLFGLRTLAVARAVTGGQRSQPTPVQSSPTRDRFLDVLRSRGMLRPGEEWVIDANLKAYAHELAEEIRVWARDPMTDAGAEEYGSVDNVLEAADRIDPEVQR